MKKLLSAIIALLIVLVMVLSFMVVSALEGADTSKISKNLAIGLDYWEEGYSQPVFVYVNFDKEKDDPAVILQGVIDKLGVSDDDIYYREKLTPEGCLHVNLTKDQIISASQFDEVRYIYSDNYDAPTSSPLDHIIGDVDHSLRVDIFDASAIQKGLAKMDGYEDYEKLRPGRAHFDVADVDGNGRVDIFDATMIQKWLAKYPEALELSIGEWIWWD